ncbi:MAG: glycosyltransferase family 2 protein [Beutenbergiaceae bacterium]
MSSGVSVVIPTHNRPQLMLKALESVLGQSILGQSDSVPLEVVIVFDACPVEVPQVSIPAGATVRGIANNRTRGLAGARNSGIVAAQHSLVAFLDDDDTWLPGKLEAQLRQLSQTPAAIVVGTAMEIDDGTRRRVRLSERDRLNHEDFLRNRHPAVHSSSLLLRREDLLGRLGLIDEDLPRSYGEDYDLLLRASALGPVHVVNQPLIVALWSGQSYYFGQWADYARALQYLLRKHPDIWAIPSALGRIEAQIAFALAASDQPQRARSWARRALRHDWRQVKAVLAVLISWHLTTPQRISAIVQRFGRGI